MKKILTLITTAALAGSLATAAFAQAAGPKNGGGQGQGLGQDRQGQGPLQNRARLGQMQKINQEILAKVNLNKRQQTKLEAAQKKLQEGLKELMAKARESQDRAALREGAQKLQTEYRETLKATLNEQQMKQYQELMRAALEKMRKGGGETDRATDRAGKGGKGGKGGGGGG